MSHTVHPYSHRLGIVRDWRSRWFALHGKFRDSLKADVLLREYLEKKLKGSYVSGVEMERGEKALRVIVKTSRPGVIIGRNGEGSEKLRKDIQTFMRKHKLLSSQELKLDIEEIKSPESNSAIVAIMIAEALEKRVPFRRIMKQTVEKVMANREVKGIKIYIGGRLGGADMARSETLKRGQIPLQTLRADIDYATTRATIPQGDLGIKVWIYKGEIFNK
jgi:small subunit ribosomal protein S3